MDSFDVIISPKALSQLNDYIDYLQYTLLNDQAAYNVWQNAIEGTTAYVDAIYHQLQDYENTFADELGC